MTAGFIITKKTTRYQPSKQNPFKPSVIMTKFISYHLSLLTLEGPEWRERRVKLSPIFTSGKMKMMFDIVDTLGDKLVDVVTVEHKTTSDLEMRDWAGRFTADVIGNVAFGLECKCKKKFCLVS